jgi:hypothetical protein
MQLPDKDLLQFLHLLAPDIGSATKSGIDACGAKMSGVPWFIRKLNVP